MANELRDAAKKIKTMPQRMVRAGADTLKSPLNSAYARASGGDGRLSGVGGMPTFRATTRVSGTTSVRGRIGMKPAGPAVWLNDGTRPRRQGSGMHPGTRAKHTFDQAVDSALPEARREMERIFGRAFD